MLIDRKQFELVEITLREQGKIAAFEAENGSVLGRMMITIDDISDEIAKSVEIKDDLRVFTASFDFYDMTISVAVYTQSMEFVSAIWLTPQTEDAEQPSKEWISFFIDKLFEAFDENGNYSFPIYSFVTDSSDMTVVPTI